MKLSHGAYGMLVQRYSTVLRKCNLINMFGSIAFASAVALGCVSPAQASGTDINTTGNMTFTSSDHYSSMIINQSHTVTVKSDGKNDVDFSINNNNPGRQPKITADFGSVKIESKGLLQIINDVAGDITPNAKF